MKPWRQNDSLLKEFTPSMMNKILKLKCAKCGKEYSPKEKICLCRNNDDGRLEIVYDYEVLKEHFNTRKQKHLNGIWRFHALLPIQERRAMVTLGEGNTPLIKAKRLAQRIRMKHLYLKDESRNPTSSFKDRSMAVGVAKALEYGVSTVVTASSGNAAAALAAYSARSNLQCYTFVPEATPCEKVSQILLYGGSVFKVRQDCSGQDSTVKALRVGVEMFKWYPCPSFGPFNPYQVEGPKTISYELNEQLGSMAPDWIILPVGAACLLAGIWKGLRDLYELGVIPDLPRLAGIQPSANSPFVKAFQNKTRSFQQCVPRKTRTVADSLLDPFPWDGDAGLEALNRTRGTATDVTDKELLHAQRVLASEEGLFASPSGAAGLAGLFKLRDEGIIETKDCVVVLVTDSGFKNMSAIKSLNKKCPTISPTSEDLQRACLMSVSNHLSKSESD